MIIGIGCDIVDINRIRSAMKHAGFPNFLTEQETLVWETLKDNRKIEWLAGRFAAKEAIYKAIHKVKPCIIKDIEILCDEDGAPYCTMKEYDVWISIAHEHDIANAYAIVTMKE